MNRRFELTVPVNASDHFLGPSHAPVTLVEYGDFECPNCKQAAPSLKLLLERHPGRVRLVWRNFPLEEIHPHALDAALAGEAAGAQGKFWQMHDLMFANQQHLKRHQLRQHAESLELDMERFDSETSDAVYLQRVREDIGSGRASGVRSTPGIFLDGEIQDVSFGLERLFDQVGAKLRAAR
ncbi:MAG TPA: thioredoxin domain-containing protein [Burkholderiales bacterium]|nr:thioredoxin domain-containing protein [Burkholderiales bacterium]HTQ78112.1 thioredoxin domain-containing protein [Burkholderiales bacterium]